MKQTRWLVALLVGMVSMVALPTAPAAACSCYGGASDVARLLGEGDTEGNLSLLGDVAFSGTVIDSGDSDVTADWSRPPRPGLALLLEVSEVWAGDLGTTVVIHTPGGRPMSGDCSVGVIGGEQFVVASRGSDGHLTSGMCTIFPGVLGDAATPLLEVLGAANPPDPAITPGLLSDPATRPPDPDEPGGLEVYEEFGGTTKQDPAENVSDPSVVAETLETSDSVSTPEVKEQRSEFWRTVIVASVVAAASLWLVLRRRNQPDSGQ